jgi:hypothetical protein
MSARIEFTEHDWCMVKALDDLATLRDRLVVHAAWLADEWPTDAPGRMPFFDIRDGALVFVLREMNSTNR